MGMNHPFLSSSESSWTLETRNLKHFLNILAVSILGVKYLQFPNVEIGCFWLCYCVNKHCHEYSGIFWWCKGTRIVWLISHLEGVVWCGTLVLRCACPTAAAFCNLLRNVNCCWGIVYCLLFCISLAPISHKTKLCQRCPQLLLLRVCTMSHLFSTYSKSIFLSVTHRPDTKRQGIVLMFLIWSAGLTQTCQSQRVYCDLCCFGKFTKMLYACQECRSQKWDTIW